MLNFLRLIEASASKLKPEKCGQLRSGIEGRPQTHAVYQQSQRSLEHYGRVRYAGQASACRQNEHDTAEVNCEIVTKTPLSGKVASRRICMSKIKCRAGHDF